MLVNCVDDSTGELISLAKIDTSKVTNMKALFYKSARSDFSGIEDWNVSNVVGFELCFAQCKTFNAPLEKWGDKIKNARTFEAMFWGAESFDRPIGAHWDTSSATNMIRMFS
ncbi:BspA family leucine-rich repeat surface protein [Helicobacter sp. 23-1044]